MRQTPAQRARLRTLAALASASGQQDPHGEPTGTAYELMQAQLHEHMRTLKGIQSVERKIDAKRTMLADFDAYLDGVLQADAGGQDVVLATVLVWHLDAGLWARGLQLADYALRHAIRLPDQYSRDLPTLLLDEVSDAAIKGQLAGVDAAVYLAHVDRLTRERDAPDQARAKLHKAIGWALIGKTATHDVDPKDIPVDQCQLALPHLQRAIELFAQVGVKKDVERLERRVKPDAPAT
ncbi:MAG: terminase [Proteobacteria bacterium]|nr:terminase [Pseudomonadota bacterium]